MHTIVDTPRIPSTRVRPPAGCPASRVFFRTIVAASALAWLGSGVAFGVPQASAGAATGTVQRKVGVLLVSHGSRSETWRAALQDLGRRVHEPLCARGTISDVQSAFMEYTEPSIATRLKEFDRQGYTDIIVVPVFLTVSPHPFDDLPTIMGQKADPRSLGMMRSEGIERYTPHARIHITPLLDFTDLLQRNVLRRARSLSTSPAREALVLVAYGDVTYERQWSALLERIARNVERETGIAHGAYAWCGHIAHYDPAKTTQAIESALRTRERAIVVPVLVAYDEKFQGEIIGGGVRGISGSPERVIYRPDAILPDPELERWIVTAATQQCERLRTVTAR